MVSNQRYKYHLERGFLIGLGAVALLASVQCNGPENDNLGVVRDEIVSGDLVSANTAGAVAVYHSTFSRPCSGTYLGNGWVMTARHCVQTDPFADGGPLLGPGDLFVTGALSPGAPLPNPASLPVGTYSNVSALVEWNLSNPSVDIAMVQLTNLLDVTKVTPPLGRVASTGGQVGLTLLCEGYGRSMNLHNPETPAGETTTGAGTLRQASLQVTAQTFNPADSPSRLDAPYQIKTSINARQQNVYSGDSGGPCFGSGPLLASVNRSVDSLVNPLPSAGFAVSIAQDTPWSGWIDWWRGNTGESSGTRTFLLN